MRSARGPARAGRPRQQREPLSKILGAIADGVVIVDGEGIVRFANAAAERLLSRPAMQLVGQVFGYPLVAGETTELDIVRPGSEPVIVEMRATSIEWKGAPCRLASLRDITARKQAEEHRLQLIQAEAARERAEAALRDRNTFLSVAAHELKTPITRLRLTMQLAVRRIDKGATDLLDVRQRLQALDNETARLAKLVDQLLDVSNIETGQLVIRRQPTDLVQVTRRVIASSQAATDQHVVTYSGPDFLLVNVDAERIAQVVENVLSNAVKYSPDGGEIKVRLDTASRPLPEEAPVARLSVTDPGIGIPPQFREGIFSRFYQAHSGDHLSGLGVGLFMCRQIVELHGGTIAAEFPEHGGTRFVVTLPLSDDLPQPPSVGRPAWPGARAMGTAPEAR